MFYTGFADEAGTDIDTQIKATLELGWDKIESRHIDGTNIHDIDDAVFDEVCGKLEDAGVSINCFGSAVANWGKDVRKPEDVQASFDELRRALPRMQRLGCKLIRGMSFAQAKDTAPDAPEIAAAVFKHVNELVKLCADAGVVYGHENCMNYGGLSCEHTLRLLDEVQPDSFTLIFDTANPVFSWDRRGEEPYHKQSSWDFYQAVKDHIGYVHIKDAVYVGETDGVFPKADFTFPGEGDGDVERIVADLLANGYDGGFSMEPHLAVVFHEDAAADDPEARARVMYENYVEYGKRFMALVHRVSPAAAGA